MKISVLLDGERQREREGGWKDPSCMRLHYCVPRTPLNLLRWIRKRKANTHKKRRRKINGSEIDMTSNENSIITRLSCWVSNMYQSLGGREGGERNDTKSTVMLLFIAHHIIFGPRIAWIKSASRFRSVIYAIKGKSGRLGDETA